MAADMRLFERGVTVSGGPGGRVLDGGRPFVWWPDAERMKEQIAAFSAPDAAAWQGWIALWRDAARL